MGATVVVLNRRVKPEQGVIDYVAPAGWRAKAVAGDVLDRAGLLEAVARIKEQVGPIYGLVNAAGGNRPAAITSANLKFFDIPEDALRSVFDLNLLGTVLPCQVVGRQMAEAGEGVILNYSSMSAYRPLTNIIAYSAAKAGMTNFTAWLAVHMARNYSGNIRVNAIAPGFFLGVQNRDLLIDKQTGNLTTPRSSDHRPYPYGPFRQPRGYAGHRALALSPASAFVTGITVPVDGGFSAFSGV